MNKKLKDQEKGLALQFNDIIFGAEELFVFIFYFKRSYCPFHHFIQLQLWVSSGGKKNKLATHGNISGDLAATMEAASSED